MKYFSCNILIFDSHQFNSIYIKVEIWRGVFLPSRVVSLACLLPVFHTVYTILYTDINSAVATPTVGHGNYHPIMRCHTPSCFDEHCLTVASLAYQATLQYAPLSKNFDVPGKRIYEFSLHQIFHI